MFLFWPLGGDGSCLSALALGYYPMANDFFVTPLLPALTGFHIEIMFVELPSITNLRKT